MSDADYELVPVTPVRKLQKEVEELRAQVKGGEGSPGSGKMTEQILEILRLNQKIVDDLTTKHTDLLSKLSETNSRLEELSDTVASLVTVLSSAAEEEIEPSSSPASSGGGDMVQLSGKLEKIVDQNAALINSLNVLGKQMGRLKDEED